MADKPKKYKIHKVPVIKKYTYMPTKDLHPSEIRIVNKVKAICRDEIDDK